MLLPDKQQIIEHAVNYINGHDSALKKFKAMVQSNCDIVSLQYMNNELQKRLEKVTDPSEIKARKKREAEIIMILSLGKEMSSLKEDLANIKLGAAENFDNAGDKVNLTVNNILAERKGNASPSAPSLSEINKADVSALQNSVANPMKDIYEVEVKQDSNISSMLLKLRNEINLLMSISEIVESDMLKEIDSSSNKDTKVLSLLFSQLKEFRDEIIVLEKSLQIVEEINNQNNLQPDDLFKKLEAQQSSYDFLQKKAYKLQQEYEALHDAMPVDMQEETTVVYSNINRNLNMVIGSTAAIAVTLAILYTPTVGFYPLVSLALSVPYIINKHNKRLRSFKAKQAEKQQIIHKIETNIYDRQIVHNSLEKIMKGIDLTIESMKNITAKHSLKQSS